MIVTEHAGRMDCAKNGCATPCKWDGKIIPVLHLDMVTPDVRRLWRRRKWYRLYDRHYARHITRTTTTSTSDWRES